MMKLDAIRIRDALPGEMPGIVDCALDAFSGFTVFGPPWSDDAGMLPARLMAMDETVSRVAIDPSGLIVGQAQWTCFSMHLEGQSFKAACLAPLAVRRESWSRGIGSDLVRDGIRVLGEKGIRFIILLGDPGYYTRFGFLPGCHGRHGLTVPLPSPLATLPDGWDLRPPCPSDPQPLLGLWHESCGLAPGAMTPGKGLLPWTSNTRGIPSCVLEYRGEVMGHCRFDSRKHAGPGNGMLRFLARTPEAASLLAARVVEWTGWADERLWLPLPPSSDRAISVLSTLAGPTNDIRPACETWPQGLAMDLFPQNKSPDIGSWLEKIREKQALPPFIEWPGIFDF